MAQPSAVSTVSTSETFGAFVTRFNTVVTNTNQVYANIGNVAALATTANSLTLAINELHTDYDAANARLGVVESNIGVMTNLVAPGGNVVAALNELNNRPIVRAWLYNTNQSIAYNQTDNVVFNTETYDTASAYDTATGTFVVPVSGFYEINAKVALANHHPFGLLSVGIAKNGSNVSSVAREGTADVPYLSNTATGIGVELDLHDIVQLSKNDQVYIRLYNATYNSVGGLSTTNASIFATANAHIAATRLDIHRIA